MIVLKYKLSTLSFNEGGVGFHIMRDGKKLVKIGFSSDKQLGTNSS